MRDLTLLRPLVPMLLWAFLASTAAQAAASRWPHAPATTAVQVRIDGHMLTLTFPPGTMRETVWFKLDALEVPRSLASGRTPPIAWRGDRELTVDLHRVKRAIRTRWVDTAWVTGQTRSGEALLQKLTLPSRRGDEPGHRH
jgi:hypothetical protein